MKKIKIMLVCILIFWITVVEIDFTCVTKKFEEPIFCIVTETLDEEGFRRYQGLGYSFKLKGNFEENDENLKITEFDAKILGLFGRVMIVD